MREVLRDYVIVPSLPGWVGFFRYRLNLERGSEMFEVTTVIVVLAIFSIFAVAANRAEKAVALKAKLNLATKATATAVKSKKK